MNQGLDIITDDIGSFFVQAFINKKTNSKARKEFGEREGSIIIFRKALYELKTSTRQWNLSLGDVLKLIGFVPSRADSDLWLKENQQTKLYEYIGTQVDDIIIVASSPEEYINTIRQHFLICKVEKILNIT